MRKFHGLIALLMVFSFAIAGCSSGGSESGKVQIEWLSHPVYSAKSSDPNVSKYIKESIKEFEQTHEKFTIKNSVLSTNIKEAMAKLLEQAAQGRAPAIAQIDSYILPRFYEYLQPLDPLMKEYGIKLEDFFPFAQKVMKGPDGKIYGIQFTTDTRVLYYRKDLIKNPPKTWEDVFEIGKKLEEQGYVPLMFPGGRGEGTTVTTVLPIFWGQGGKLVNEQGEPVFGKGENRKKMLNVLKYVQNLVEKGITPKRVATYGSESDLNKEVATGNVAMFLGGSWQVNQLKSILGEEKFTKNWAVAPIPQMKGAKKATTAGGWSWGIFTDDPEKKKAAFEFLVNTFVGDKGMANWANIGGYLPTRKSIYKQDNYKGNKYTSEFKVYLEEHAKTRPASSEYSDISSQLQIAVSSVVSGEKSPKEALNDAWEVVQE